MRTLRMRLAAQEMVCAPGVADGLTARVAADLGFDALFMSGYHVAASLGFPDMGLVTMSETVERARQIGACTPLPLIVDGDNGYGNALNVIRTVRELEQVGAAGVMIEDQVFPKRCGGLSGIEMVSTEEMVRKIRAARDARRNPETLVIARTDGFNAPGGGAAEAIARARKYEEAGADVLLVHGLKTREDLVAARAALRVPLMLTIGSRIDLSIEELDRLGYRLVVYPLTALRSALVAMRHTLSEVRSKGVIDHGSEAFMPMPQLHRIVGAPEFDALEKRYA
ncbi:MAG TPA: isocitrate lyase/PEP mutase family protein [Usitatibacter sp.]|nr:isocitrate lyase/PEP mutase family protein [Usitatibacter sp.]